MYESIKVLVVDDKQEERKDIIHALAVSHTYFEIVEAASLSQAITYLRREHFDVVLADYNLEYVDGIEAIIEIKNVILNENVALIVVSSDTNEVVALECINAGAQDFVLKDTISSAQLSRAILQSKKRHELELQLLESYQQVKELAERDRLTGLFNRYYFDDALTHMLARTEDNQTLTAVMMLDLDKFKDINDNFGHEVGDKLLIEVADRIRKVCRDNELLARLGGDEFAYACAGLTSVREVEKVAKRILACFALPFFVAGKRLYCHGSLGVAIAPLNGVTVGELKKCADIAMYRAKRSSTVCLSVFEDNMQQSFLRKYKIETEVRDAIEHGFNGYQLYFQPIVDCRGQRICGLETLLRWPNAKISNKPDEFIPVAEEAGLIKALGKWVILQTFAQFDYHLTKTNCDVYISINVSPHQLQERDFANFVLGAMQRYKVKPQNLVFEITETALLSDDEQTILSVNQLHQLGIRFALDDFGTGFSSIANLLNFPIEVVKVDKMITQQLVREETKKHKMVEALVKMLDTLNVPVIVEGVETFEHAQACSLVNVQFIQGFYYYPPMPFDDAVGLIESQRLALGNSKTMPDVLSVN